MDYHTNNYVTRTGQIQIINTNYCLLRPIKTVRRHQVPVKFFCYIEKIYRLSRKQSEIEKAREVVHLRKYRIQTVSFVQ